MSKQLNVIITDEAYEILGNIQEHIMKSEMLDKCTQSHAITKALIVMKDKINTEGE